MIARLLARYADASLRAELDKAVNAREAADDRARRAEALLKVNRNALETQAAITERWRGIARKAQDDLARARTRETPDPDRLSMVAPNGCDDCSVEPFEHHRYPNCPGNERTRTQETSQ